MKLSIYSLLGVLFAFYFQTPTAPLAQRQNMMAGPIVSLLCPSSPAISDSLTLMQTTTVDNAKSLTFTVPAGTIPAGSSVTKVSHTTQITIFQNGVAFGDVTTTLAESPISTAVGNYVVNNSTVPQTAGAVASKTINVTPLGNPAGAWKFNINSGNFLGNGVDEIEVKITLKVVWSKPETPSTCDTIICRGTSFVLDAGISGGSYIWSTGATSKTITVTQSGNYKVTVTNAQNEISVDDANVTFKSIQVNKTAAICSGEQFVVGDSTYTTAGVKTNTLLRANGCDSVVVTTLTVHPTPAPKNNPVQLCNGESYTINGHTYNMTGTYKDTFPSFKGCDSIIITVITTAPAKTANNPQQICIGESYTINGHTYTMAGEYKDTLQTASGCDSIVTTKLRVNAPTAKNNPQEICQGESYIINGKTYTLQGTYKDTLTNFLGCDSVVTTILKVFQHDLENVTAKICQGKTYTVGSSTYTLAGTYKDTLQTFHGCDSIIITNLTVTSVLRDTFDIGICEGQSYNFAGQSLTTSGTYMKNFISSAGCDSIVTIKLKVDKYIEKADKNVTLCFGAAYQGVVYVRDTLLKDTIISPTSCDTIFKINIDVLPELKVKVNAYGANCTTTGLQAIATGGSGGYSFKWSNNSTSPIQNNLPNGTFNVTVTDSAGCKAFGSGDVGTSAGISVDSEVTDVTCNGLQDGAIKLFVFGTPPYTFKWSNGAVVQDLVNVRAGNYSVLVKDANGCSFATTLTVEEPSQLNVFISTTPSTGGFNGTATAIVVGGTPSYSFLWSNGKTVPYITGLGTGNLTVRVKDSNGCEVSAQATIGNTTPTYSIESLKGVTLMPNPSNGVFNALVEFDAVKDVNLSIFNIQGQIVQKIGATRGSNLHIPIDLKDAQNGTYFFVIQAEGKMHAERFVVLK